MLYIVFCDLPCFICGFIVCITLWRADLLYSKLQGNSRSEARWTTFKEFLNLLRDLVLIPLFLVDIVCIWRIPQLISKIWGALGGKPSNQPAAFDVTEAEYHFPGKR